jgi:hypothetical protein
MSADVLPATSKNPVGLGCTQTQRGRSLHRCGETVLCPFAGDKRWCEYVIVTAGGLSMKSIDFQVRELMRLIDQGFSLLKLKWIWHGLSSSLCIASPRWIAPPGNFPFLSCVIFGGFVSDFQIHIGDCLVTWSFEMFCQFDSCHEFYDEHVLYLDCPKYFHFSRIPICDGGCLSSGYELWSLCAIQKLALQS